MSGFLVAAIDFGTTFSGYAFSFVHEYKRDPLTISNHIWVSGVCSEKTSTCVLFDANGKVASFGFDAEKKYSELASENKHRDWYYFRRFKMMLYNETRLTKDTQLKDDKGKQMEAMKVFSSVIEQLKNHLIEKCKKQFGDIEIEDSDVTWVLTVPAIWDDPSKQFMREAANKAGIFDQNLIIALEPEAASLYCMYQPVLKDTGTSSFGVFKPGAQYMVVDAGGGTIDITVHEVQNNGTLKEIHKANGGDWGGTRVDIAFENLLSEVVGKAVMDAFRLNEKYDFLELLQDFERKKRDITPVSTSNVIFHAPSSLVDIFKKENPGKDIKTVVDSKPTLKDKLSIVRDKLRIDAQLFKTLYDESLDKIIHHLQQIFRHPSVKDVPSILLVGGYAESLMLQMAIKKAFPNKKVIVPKDARIAVLKGAVLYGHEPKTMSDRVCRYTYGVRSSVIFNSATHPKSKKIVENGVDRCNDIFNIHVRVGESVKVDEPHVEKEYGVVNPNQKSLIFQIYVSQYKNPMFTTDEGCKYLGKFSIDIPDISKGMDRGAKVRMTFSGTEIRVTAVDKDNSEKIVSTRVDFLG